jgi:hypothetical protein
LLQKKNNKNLPCFSRICRYYCSIEWHCIIRQSRLVIIIVNCCYTNIWWILLHLFCLFIKINFFSSLSFFFLKHKRRHLLSLFLLFTFVSKLFMQCEMRFVLITLSVFYFFFREMIYHVIHDVSPPLVSFLWLSSLSSWNIQLCESEMTYIMWRMSIKG